jgi:hypothetical protein
MTRYARLQAKFIHETIETLRARISERFPGSGLSQVASELLVVSDQNRAVVARLRKPLWPIRALTAITVAALVLLAGWALLQLFGHTWVETTGVADLLQSADAATNQLLLLSLALAFLVSLETRIKRRDALRMLHRLRSVAHIVDMHQLTKDPEIVLRSMAATASSPVRVLTPPQLARYLDYCSEMLALTSKLAALHAQHLQDPVVLNAVNDIESLTADLARTIWQKLSILDMSITLTPGASTSSDLPSADATRTGTETGGVPALPMP